MANDQKKDPIREAYYAPLENAENWQTAAFYLAAVLSFAVLLVDRSSSDLYYNVVHVAFVLMVIAVFVIGHTIRLYLAPRAEGTRRSDSIANAFSANTAHPRTVGYYSNNQSEPSRRLAANTLESSLFSKSIALQMARGQRTQIAIYAVLWFATATLQRWDLAISAAGAQAVFSEQILSRWLRLEWLRMRFETSFKQLAQLFESPALDAESMRRRVFEELCFYETSKAYAGVVLSWKIKAELNRHLDEEWNEIRKNLKI